MKKSFNSVSKAAIAAALAGSSLVPAAVVGAETPATQNDVSKVVFAKDGQNLEISLSLFNDLLVEGLYSTADIKYITDTKGNHYLLEQFNDALAEAPTFAGALNVLEKANLQQAIEVTEGKLEGTEIVPGQTPSIPEGKVVGVDTGSTLTFMVGKTPKLPDTVDALVTYLDEATEIETNKIESGLSVKWAEGTEVLTDEVDYEDTITGTVTFKGKEYTVDYNYRVVANTNEAKKLAALEKMQQIEDYDLANVDVAASEASDAASNASDEASNLSEESTTAERDAAQKLVDEAKKLIEKAEKDLQEVKAAFDAAKAEAVKYGATADDFYTEELDTSSVEEYIADANNYIADAEAYIKGEELPVRVTDAVAINATTIKVTFSDGHVQEYPYALVEGENKVEVEYDGKKYTVTVNYTATLKVESVSAINATTLKVTFAGKEPVNVTVAELVDGQTKVTFTYEGKTYTATLDKPYEAPITELVVKSVTAVNTTIKAEANQQLPIKVNGSKEVTVEELKAAGYTVDFKYNKASETIYNRKTGVVNGSADGIASEFKYQVVVTPAEGAAIESNWADVKVVDASKAVKVTQVGLSNELSYVTLEEADVTLKVQKAINGFGEELKEADLPAIDSVVSSDPTVAYVDGNEIVTRKEGTVTFTVKFAEKDLEDVTLTVEVKAKQKATSINAKNVKVEAGSAIIDLSEYYDILDQYGEKMRTDLQKVVEVTNSKGVLVDKLTGDLATGLSKEDVYTVVVKLSDGTKLGSFTITTVDVANKEVDEFKLTTAEGFEIDINPETTKDSADIKVEAYIEGVKVSNVSSKLNGIDPKFELRTSDKDVVLIKTGEKAEPKAKAKENNTLVGVKAGKATISLVKIEGDLETVVATYEVEVKNTVKLVTAVNFKEGIKAVTVPENIDGMTEAELQAALQAAVLEATNLEVKNIKEVEYVEANEVVIVKITNEYGGKEFVLAAEKAVNGETTPDTATVTELTKLLDSKVLALEEKNIAANKLLKEIKDLEGKTAAAFSNVRVASLTGILAAQETTEDKIKRLKAELATVLYEIEELKKEVTNLLERIDVKLVSATEEEKIKVVASKEKAEVQQEKATTALNDAAAENIKPEKPEKPEDPKPDQGESTNPGGSNVTITTGDSFTVTISESITTADIAEISNVSGVTTADVTAVVKGTQLTINFNKTATVNNKSTITIKGTASNQQPKIYVITFDGKEWKSTLNNS